MKPLLAIAVIVVAFFAPARGASPSIQLSDESPVVGQAITVTLPVAVDTLTVTYRPNSSVATTEYVVNRPAASTFQWASRNPGLVELSYPDRSSASGPARVKHNVSVRFAGVSVSGLAVMFGAGIILFGGAAFAFRTLFRDTAPGERPDLDPEQLPDT